MNLNAIENYVVNKGSKNLINDSRNKVKIVGSRYLEVIKNTATRNDQN